MELRFEFLNYKRKQWYNYGLYYPILLLRINCRIFFAYWNRCTNSDFILLVSNPPRNNFPLEILLCQLILFITSDDNKMERSDSLLNSLRIVPEFTSGTVQKSECCECKAIRLFRCIYISEFLSLFFLPYLIEFEWKITFAIYYFCRDENFLETKFKFMFS